ncbi:MAG: hypothetical protein LQ349_009136, partial [Xanthoria aureola]
VAERGNEGSACGFGDAPEIFLLRTADSHGALFDEELEDKVVDALGGEEDVCAGLEDHGHALSDDRSLPGTNLFELRGVVDGDVDTELHALLLEIHIQHGDLGVGNASLHGLRGNGTVERIAFDEYRFGSRGTMRFEDVYSFDGILDFTTIVGGFHRLHCVHNEIGKEVAIGSDDLGRHRGFSDVDKRLSTKRLDFGTDILRHVLDSFPEG